LLSHPQQRLLRRVPRLRRLQYRRPLRIATYGVRQPRSISYTSFLIFPPPIQRPCPTQETCYFC
jgi:hypothetical protein